MAFHPGTSLAKNFRSRIRVTGKGIDREAVVSMNRPFRYGPYALVSDRLFAGKRTPLVDPYRRAKSCTKSSPLCRERDHHGRPAAPFSDSFCRRVAGNPKGAPWLTPCGRRCFIAWRFCWPPPFRQARLRRRSHICHQTQRLPFPHVHLAGSWCLSQEEKNRLIRMRATNSSFLQTAHCRPAGH